MGIVEKRLTSNHNYCLSERRKGLFLFSSFRFADFTLEGFTVERPGVTVTGTN